MRHTGQTNQIVPYISCHAAIQRVAAEEAHQFSLLREHLLSLGMQYGEQALHQQARKLAGFTDEELALMLGACP
jgi:uncharacterized ferritin-like protein (DUF455 family)